MKDENLEYWFARRKEYESKLIQIAMRTKWKTKAFVHETKRITDELAECTKRIDEIKGSENEKRN